LYLSHDHFNQLCSKQGKGPTQVLPHEAEHTHYLLECVMPLLQSESLRGKCAELHTVAASNSRDQEITLVVIISKYYQLFTSFTGIIRDHSPRSLHRDNSIIACSHHIYMSLILDTHPVRGESHIQRNANREVATPLWALSCLETESLTYLASLTHRVT